MIYLGITLFILLVAAGIIYRCTYSTTIVKVKRGEIFNFKTALDLTGMPIITLYQGENKYNFILDSGANVSSIQEGTQIAMAYTEETDSMMGIGGRDLDCKHADIKLEKDGVQYEHEFRVTDLSAIFNDIYQCTNVRVVGLIGGDFMSKYNYCLDYCEYVAYTRKP